VTAALQALAAGMTEAKLQANVIELARVYGWLVHHTRPAQRQSGSWSTPIQGDAGYPDLTLAKPGSLLLVELKSQRGTRTRDQIRWAQALHPHYRLWRPADWLAGNIRRALVVA
jgi:hypothetical protein